MPRKETPNYALRRAVVATAAVIILLIGVGVPMAIYAPVPRASAEVSPEVTRSTRAATPALPSFGSSAIGAVGMPGLLAKSGPQQPRTIASITKIITALVVLQAKPLQPGEDGPTITFTDRDVQILSDVMARNGSSEPVQAGWRTTQRAAMETMLIPSANNYAESLAVWAYGSVPKYLAAADAWLDAHGLDDTTLVDANGLDERDRSTPEDLVDLGRLALEDPVISAIVRKKSADEPNVGTVDNTNQLLGDDGVDGIKTGTYTTGANLLFSADVKVGGRTVELVGVVLGAATHPQLDARVPALLASVRKGLHDVRLTTKDSSFATYRMKWGGVAKAVPQRSASMLVWSRVRVERQADVKQITGGRKGERVGTVTYTVGDRKVAVPLVLDRDVLAAPVWWRLTNPIR